MKTVGFAVIALLGANVAVAQAGDVFTCRKISNDSARLQCYDGLFGMTAGASTGANAVKASKMQWSDLQTDYQDLVGQTVTTTGSFTFFGENALLTDDRGGMAAMLVNIEKLPRDQRRALYKSCTMPCTVNITGTVGDVMMQRGLTATSVALD